MEHNKPTEEQPVTIEAAPLTIEEANHILSFLARVQLSGEEAPLFVQCVDKIKLLATKA